MRLNQVVESQEEKNTKCNRSEEEAETRICVHFACVIVQNHPIQYTRSTGQLNLKAELDQIVYENALLRIMVRYPSHRKISFK